MLLRTRGYIRNPAVKKISDKKKSKLKLSLRKLILPDLKR
jgi:hypothetical protein